MSEVLDNRERCPTCNRIAPQHNRWCITPVIEGKKVMETREIEGTQSAPIQKELDNAN